MMSLTKATGSELGCISAYKRAAAPWMWQAQASFIRHRVRAVRSAMCVLFARRPFMEVNADEQQANSIQPQPTTGT